MQPWCTWPCRVDKMDGWTDCLQKKPGGHVRTCHASCLRTMRCSSHVAPSMPTCTLPHSQDLSDLHQPQKSTHQWICCIFACHLLASHLTRADHDKRNWAEAPVHTSQLHLPHGAVHAATGAFFCMHSPPSHRCRASPDLRARGSGACRAPTPHGHFHVLRTSGSRTLFA